MSRAALIACSLLAACGSETPTDADLPTCGTLRGGHWDQRLVTPGVAGSSAEVKAIVRRADGAIIVGGQFASMSGVKARNIAVWDGTAWTALGDGLQSAVGGIAVDDSGTIWAVGTQFFGKGELDGKGGGGYVARWDGTEWTYATQNAFGVEGVAAIDGGIAVFGQSLSISGVNSQGIAFLRDGLWSGSNLASGGVTSVVRTGSGFCASGYFQFAPFAQEHAGAACWSNSTWTTLGGYLGLGRVLARSPNGTWYLGGEFAVTETLDEAHFGEDRYGIVELNAANGVWYPFQGGVGRESDLVSYIPRVSAISFDGSSMVIAGHFGRAGLDQPAFNVARWQADTGWSAMTASTEDVFGELTTVLATGGRSFVGGRFARIGGAPGAGIASLDGNHVGTLPDSTLAPPFTGSPSDLIVTEDGILVTGVLCSGDCSASDPASSFGLSRFDGAWGPTGNVFPASEDIIGVGLASHGAAVRADNKLYRMYGEGRWTQLVDETVGGPLLADGDGTLFFHVPRTPQSTIARATAEETHFYASVPGRPTHMAIYNDELVVVATNFDGNHIVLRQSGDDWVVIGAFAEAIIGVASSPAIGVVIATEFATRIWNGTEWRSLPSTAQVHDIGACSDGVVAAISREGEYELAFLPAAATEWEKLADVAPATSWHIEPTKRGIYMTSNFGALFGTTTSFARFATQGDDAW